jgi:hypothetical protein
MQVLTPAKPGARGMACMALPTPGRRPAANKTARRPCGAGGRPASAPPPRAGAQPGPADGELETRHDEPPAAAPDPLDVRLRSHQALALYQQGSYVAARAEWRALVHAAGFEPRVRALILASAPPRQVGSPPLLPIEHRCPVCQFVRYARRPVSVWRCAACRAGGGSGELTITRRTPA